MKVEARIRQLEKQIRMAKLLEPETKQARETVRLWIAEKIKELEQLATTQTKGHQ